MGRDLVAGEKLGHLVGEGVAVVLKQSVPVSSAERERYTQKREKKLPLKLSDTFSIYSTRYFCLRKVQKKKSKFNTHTHTLPNSLTHTHTLRAERSGHVSGVLDHL